MLILDADKKNRFSCSLEPSDFRSCQNPQECCYGIEVSRNGFIS